MSALDLPFRHFSFSFFHLYLSLSSLFFSRTSSYNQEFCHPRIFAAEHFSLLSSNLLCSAALSFKTCFRQFKKPLLNRQSRNAVSRSSQSPLSPHFFFTLTHHSIISFSYLSSVYFLGVVYFCMKVLFIIFLSVGTRNTFFFCNASWTLLQNTS
jgi:hypothetical protein